MQHRKTTHEDHRAAQRLTLLARTIYELAASEKDAHLLRMIEKIALRSADLFDEVYNTSGELQPDLGTNLVEFIQLKADLLEVSEQGLRPGKEELPKLVEIYRSDVSDMLEHLQRKYGRALNT